MPATRQIPLQRLGFSLIELLAAITVIMILGAMVFSVMHSVRGRADEVQCMNNLRQMHVYLSGYAQENAGDFPAAVDAESGISWWLNLQRYIDSQDQEVDVGKETIFLCPTAMETYPGGVARRTYAMNIEGIADWRTPVNVFRVKEPARTLFIMDAAHNAAADTGDGTFYFRLPQFHSAVGARHEGHFNALFLDGHTESLLPDGPRVETLVGNLAL